MTSDHHRNNQPQDALEQIARNFLGGADEQF
jgi:hypothetical protein